MCTSSDPIVCAKAVDKYIYDNNIPNKNLNFPEDYPDYNELIIIKTECKEIDENTVGLLLKNDIIVKIDKNDYERIKIYKWWISKDGYVESNINKKSIRIHRYLLENPKNKFIDHINRDKLDNRRSNLRIVTALQNAQNTSVRKSKKNTQYRGISFYDDRYYVRFIYYKQNIYLGRYENEIEAAETFDMYIVHNNISEIELNFPSKKEEYLKRNFDKYEHNPTSKYNYVHFNKKIKKFIGSLQYNKQIINICRSVDEEFCAKEVDRYIFENNIPNKDLNFPEDYPTYNKHSIIKTECDIIDENTVKLLINNNGDIIIKIDKEDYDKIKYYKWYIGKHGYVSARCDNNKITLHRFLMNETDPDIFIDHIDSDTYNNTKFNLRKSCPIKNAQNRSKKKDALSQYHGVHLLKYINTYQIFVANKHIGYEKNEIYAARRRDLYILMNIPDSHYKMNFKWNDQDISEWKKILNID